MDDLVGVGGGENFEPVVNEVLKGKFESGLIYTNVGEEVLVSINPFEKLPICSDEVATEYQSGKYRQKDVGEESKDAGENISPPPHIFERAAKVLRAVTKRRQSHAFVVSGESGAGKTEACKLILRFVAANEASEAAEEDANVSKVAARLIQQMTRANPILEAFGNAKSVRNDNSSRFGKLLTMAYINGSLQGASMRHYLLEKSRVVGQAANERNFHVFYGICAGLGAEEKEKFHLKNYSASSFRMLTQGECLTIPGVDDSRDWKDCVAALEDVGVNEEQRKELVQLLVGLLHAGNVEFEGDDKPKISGKCSEHLQPMTQLLGIENEVLEKALCTRTIKMGQETYVKPNDMPQCSDARDTMIKAIYSKLFDWLFDCVNELMASAAGGGESTSSGGKEGRSELLILDIFGFEIFPKNSFEQLCINFANERLQQLFVKRVFRQELEEYESEGLTFDAVSFTDNRACCDLIDGKGGVLALLDEECTMPKGSDESLTDKLTSAHGKHAHFEKPRIGKTLFIIKHFAGPVTYDGTGFLAKNKDAVKPDLIKMFSTSSVSLLSQIFKEAAAQLAAAETDSPKSGGKGGGGASKFAGGMFKQSLASLISSLEACEINYVRCIRPNNSKKPKEWTPDDVLRQLRCNSVIEAIRLRRAGFVYRKYFADFSHEFWQCGALKLGFPPKDNKVQLKEFCTKLMTFLETNYLPSGSSSSSSDDKKKVKFMVGSNKVFIRSGDDLTAFRDGLSKLTTKCASRIVVVCRIFAARRRMKRKRDATKVLQAFIRRLSLRKSYSSLSVAAKYSSAVCSRYLHSHRHQTTIHGCRIMGASVSRMQLVTRYHRMLLARWHLQGCMRGVLFRNMVSAALRMQSMSRMIVTRRQTCAIRITRCFRRIELNRQWKAVYFAGKSISSYVKRASAFYPHQVRRIAITSIQGVIRKTLARKWFNVPLWRFVAPIVQASIRRQITSYRYRLRISSAIVLSAAITRRPICVEYRRLRRNIVVIQAPLHRFVCRVVPIRRQRATAIRCQSFLRRRLALLKWKSSHGASVIVAKWMCAFLVRTPFRAHKVAISRVQASCRRLYLRKRYRSALVGCNYTTKICRRAIVHRGLHRKVLASMACQGILRRALERRRVVRRLFATKDLQRVLRRTLPRVRFCSGFAAALCLTSKAIRSFFRRRYVRRVRSVVMMRAQLLRPVPRRRFVILLRAAKRVSAAILRSRLQRQWHEMRSSADVIIRSMEAKVEAKIMELKKLHLAVLQAQLRRHGVRTKSYLPYRTAARKIALVMRSRIVCQVLRYGRAKSGGAILSNRVKSTLRGGIQWKNLVLATVSLQQRMAAIPKRRQWVKCFAAGKTLSARFLPRMVRTRQYGRLRSSRLLEGYLLRRSEHALMIARKRGAELLQSAIRARFAEWYLFLLYFVMRNIFPARIARVKTEAKFIATRCYLLPRIKARYYRECDFLPALHAAHILATVHSRHVLSSIRLPRLCKSTQVLSPFLITAVSRHLQFLPKRHASRILQAYCRRGILFRSVLPFPLFFGIKQVSLSPSSLDSEEEGDEIPSDSIAVFQLMFRNSSSTSNLHRNGNAFPSSSSSSSFAQVLFASRAIQRVARSSISRRKYIQENYFSGRYLCGCLYRAFVQQSHYVPFLRSVNALRSFFIRQALQKNLLNFVNARRLQCRWRTFVARRIFRLQLSALRIQTFYRQHRSREIVARYRAVARLQSVMQRCFFSSSMASIVAARALISQCRQSYHNKRFRSFVAGRNIQCSWRMHQARRRVAIFRCGLLVNCSTQRRIACTLFRQSKFAIAYVLTPRIRSTIFTRPYFAQLWTLQRTILLRFAKMQYSRSQLATVLVAATILSSSLRRLYPRLLYRHLYRKVCMLQRAQKCWVARLEYSCRLRAIQVLRLASRRFKTECRYPALAQRFWFLSMKRSAMELSQFIRSIYLRSIWLKGGVVLVRWIQSKYRCRRVRIGYCHTRGFASGKIMTIEYTSKGTLGIPMTFHHRARVSLEDGHVLVSIPEQALKLNSSPTTASSSSLRRFRITRNTRVSVIPQEDRHGETVRIFIRDVENRINEDDKPGLMLTMPSQWCWRWTLAVKYAIHAQLLKVYPLTRSIQAEITINSEAMKSIMHYLQSGQHTQWPDYPLDKEWFQMNLVKFRSPWVFVVRKEHSLDDSFVIDSYSDSDLGSARKKSNGIRRLMDVVEQYEEDEARKRVYIPSISSPSVIYFSPPPNPEQLHSIQIEEEEQEAVVHFSPLRGHRILFSPSSPAPLSATISPSAPNLKSFLSTLRSKQQQQQQI